MLRSPPPRWYGSTRLLTCWTGLLLLAAIAPRAYALDEQTLRACATLRDANERLQCYDSAVGRIPRQPSGDERALAPSSPDHSANSSPTQTSAARERSQSAPPPSMLTRRWQPDYQNEKGLFLLTPYKPVYVLPLTYNTRPNQEPSGVLEKQNIDHLEIKFQLSFKARLWPDLFVHGGDLWFGYTQLSFWQAYKWNASAPFRETNYEPELIYSLRTHFNLFGLYGRLLTLSLDHQSNGRSEPLSRSWNRIIGGVLLDNGTIAFQLRGWWRIPEPARDDDNPGIEDYVGRGELWGFYRHDEQTFGLMLRSNLELPHERGAVQFNWVTPLAGPLKGYLQWFYGYGDGLIDYNHINNRFSLGLMLIDWM